MKNIFIEGIQGMGKSTLLQAIASKYPEYQVCHEGDYSPVELAWCAWLTKEEYEGVLGRYEAIREEIEKHTVIETMDVDNQPHYVVCYTQIITDISGFHKDLEQYEIYNGRKSFEEMQEIVLKRYERFFSPDKNESRKDSFLFECAFLQNIVKDLILFHQLSDDEIVDFYKKLYETVDKEKFTLLYLYDDNLEESTSIIKKERSDAQGNEMWYPLMLKYLVNSPYGKAHGYKDFGDMVAHFKHRQQLELRILNEVVGENAKMIPAREWDAKFLDEMIL